MSDSKIVEIIEQHAESIKKAKDILLQKIKDTNKLLKDLEREYEQKLGMLYTSNQLISLVKATLDAKIDEMKEKEKTLRNKRTSEEVNRLKQLKKEQERKIDGAKRTIIK